jgi:hypothetical protein
MTPMFKVVLDRHVNNASYGTTEDVVEADSAYEAEEQAIAAWRELDPRFSYRALLTVDVTEPEH